MGQSLTSWQTRLLSLKHIGLDSMCFLYQLADHPTYAPLTQVIFELLDQKKITAVTSTITVAEVFVHAEHSGDAITLSTYETMLQAIPHLTFVPIDWRLARLASKLRATYPKLKTPDAVQLSAALATGCRGFITNDKHIPRVSDVEILTLDSYVS